MLYEVIICGLECSGLIYLNMNLTNRKLLTISNADAHFVYVDRSMYLRLKMVLWRKINVNTASYVLRD